MKYFFISLICTIFLACSQKNTHPEKKIFRYNESKGIATLDPAFARMQTIIWPVHQLFNGLVQLDSTLQIKPCIAKNWNISKDGKTYTFYLRNDVYFHEHKLFNRKRKVIASDFVYSLYRIIDPAVASPGAWIFNNLDKNPNNNFTGFKALNDTTFCIYLKTPFPAFLGLLSMEYCSVVPKEIVEHYKQEFRSNPVGTGPFKFKMWKDGEKLILVKNTDYFETDEKGNKLPYLDAINISFINDKQSEFLEFVKGNIDFISGITASVKDELILRNGQLNPKYSNKFKMIISPYLNTEYLGILVDTTLQITQNSPLKNIKIRQAINYGIDKEKMMKYLRNNIGAAAIHGFIPQGMPGFDTTLIGYQYNPDKARQLIAEAGFTNGKTVPTITLVTTSDYADLCEFIQNQLSMIGIPLNIEIATGSSFREMVANSKLTFFRGSWIADYPDAENYLALFYSKNFSPAGPNYTHFSNHTFDKLYELAMNQPNDSLRYILYKQMDKLIIEHSPIVPLYYDKAVRFIRNEINGMHTNAMNMLDLKNVTKKFLTCSSK